MVEHGHDLDAMLSEWRREEVSLRAAAERLASRYGIEVAHTTVERWLGYPG